MQKKKIIITILLIIGGISPFISFGQEQPEGACLTCGSSPANLNLINSFTTEILANIKTIGTEDPYAGKHVPPSRFDSGKFVAPKQNIMSKTLRRAKESLGSVLAIKRINLELDDAINFGDSLGVLASNKTILRDRQKISKMEQDINRKKYELSVGGGRTDKIDGVTLQRMQSIIKRYQDLGIITNSTKITKSSEYGDLILILGKLNSSLKSLIAGMGGLTDEENQPSFDLRTSGKVALKIETKAINQIKSDYECTKRYACEQSRTNIKDEIKKMKESFKDGVGTAGEQISIATQELKKAYSLENLKKTFRTENTIVNQFSGALNNLKNRRERAKENREIRKDTRAENKEVKNAEDQAIDKLREEGKANETIENAITTVNKETIINSFKSRIQDTQSIIDKEANDMINKYETIKIPDIMTYFVAISQKITSITKNIIGSKDGDSCLIKNLGALCEKQCSNIGNKTCYY